MINGFIIIDKPAGITSHGVVSRVRRILGTRKVGHTGTLDPFATGVLPVAVNDGTKAIPFLDEGSKSYEAVMQLGVNTDTLDLTGTVLREGEWRGITRAALEAVLDRFRGAITQIPPMYSALKRDGQPLYKLARQGQTVERAPRSIEIYSLELTKFEPPLAAFRVDCSRGTYVRTLAEDIGKLLGCGAALKELRRTASGPFHAAAAVTLEQLELAAREGTAESMVVSSSAALGHLRELPVSEQARTLISHGRSPEWSDLEPVDHSGLADGCLVRLVHKSELLAVARYHDAGDAGQRVTLKRVFL